MTAAVDYTLSLKVRSVECCKCGHLILMTADFQERRRKDHVFWYCTSCGQSQHWGGPNVEEKLRKDLEGANRRAQVHRDLAESERAAREQTELRLRAQRGQSTKLRNRIRNGVCPCCSRTFVNLMSHMKGQHPDFKATPEA